MIGEDCLEPLVEVCLARMLPYPRKMAPKVSDSHSTLTRYDHAFAPDERTALGDIVAPEHIALRAASGYN